MNRTTFRHCLSLLLACVLLVQAAFAVAEWHVELPTYHPHGKVTYAIHCPTLSHPSSSSTEMVQGHHHHCYQCGSTVALQPNAHGVPSTVRFARIAFPGLDVNLYRNPHTDQWIRPPIA